jgi:isocitrate dehydrogenase kinase/phosphatase
MTAMYSDSRLANEGAHVIATAWNDLIDRFSIVTRRARHRFLAADWQAIAADHVERLDLYAAFVARAESDIRALLGDRLEARDVWIGMRAVYSGLVNVRPDWELAETFYNSITRRIFDTVGVDPRIEFVSSDYPDRAPGPVGRLVTSYRGENVVEALRAVLEDVGLDGACAALDQDLQMAAGRLLTRADQMGAQKIEAIEILPTVFFRGSGAYVVGQMSAAGRTTPFALALLHPPGGVRIDAVMTTENELSVLFSFTRSYFHVAIDHPHEVVAYLRGLMPRKRRAELFISLGYNKHGKTELFRELMGHLGSSQDRFEMAAGVPGLVMVVFTLPGFDVVFKVIRDRFGAPKQITRDRVMNRYRLVFRHDRAGRLVDAQEYEHLSFAADRFDPELLDQLLEACSRTVARDGDTVHIAHAYVERRVTPLDLYVHEYGGAAAEAAIVDYGQAIKDLAASGIFPGDMLLKNFGVTRHGRVVFYDYDELTTLDECTFRTIPVSDDPYDDMSAEPWFSVGPGDIFPEEFETFLGLSGRLAAVFRSHHGDVFEAAAWREWQLRVAQGDRLEVFPYTSEQRLVKR